MPVVDIFAEVDKINVAHLATGFNGWVESGGTVRDFASDSRWMRKPTDKGAST